MKIGAFAAGAAFALSVVAIHAQAPTGSDEARASDAAAIRAQIEIICQAFIDGDIQRIYSTHAADWRGFLEGSRSPIKGIDEYMRANGIAWPPASGSAPSSAAAPSGTSRPPAPAPSAAPGSRGFALKDYDLHFLASDIAVVNFIVEFNRTTNDETVVTSRLRIMDVYSKRADGWIQVASNTVTDPAYLQERLTSSATVSAAARQQILDARETVWRAYFAGDRATLERVIADEIITIDGRGSTWGTRASILAASAALADRGTKLVSLEFPKTELQIYGSVILVYTTYRYVTETNGTRSTTEGHGTEMFVRRNGTLVNVGWHLTND